MIVKLSLWQRLRIAWRVFLSTTHTEIPDPVEEASWEDYKQSFVDDAQFEITGLKDMIHQLMAMDNMRSREATPLLQAILSSLEKLTMMHRFAVVQRLTMLDSTVVSNPALQKWMLKYAREMSELASSWE